MAKGEAILAKLIERLQTVSALKGVYRGHEAFELSDDAAMPYATVQKLTERQVDGNGPIRTYERSILVIVLMAVSDSVDAEQDALLAALRQALQLHDRRLWTGLAAKLEEQSVEFDPPDMRARLTSFAVTLTARYIETT